MGKEFKVIKETATVCATIIELAAIDTRIRTEITSPDFYDEYDSLLKDILSTYQAFVNILKPLTGCHDQTAFTERFPALAQQYESGYQQSQSVARINAEFTFEKYLQFQKRKELKTRYPPLKATFSRLHDLIDKWIDNDIWLAMSIDTVLKMLNLIVIDIKENHDKDIDDAYSTYAASIGTLLPLLETIEGRVKKLEQESAICD